MNYQEARSQIQTGDAILVRGRHGLLTPLTKFFTSRKQGYTHAGLAFWIGTELWMGEINGGRNHAVPLSQLQNESFDVYKRPAQISAAAADAAIYHALRFVVDYSVLALVVIGLKEWLKLNLVIHWRNFLVCSGWCIWAYQLCGWPDCSRIMSPQKFSEMLELRFRVN